MRHRLLRRAMPIPPPPQSPRTPGVAGGRLFASLPLPPPLQSRRYLTTLFHPSVAFLILWLFGTATVSMFRGRHGNVEIGWDVSWGCWGSGFRQIGPIPFVEAATGAMIHGVGEFLVGPKWATSSTPVHFGLILGWTNYLMVQCCQLPLVDSEIVSSSQNLPWFAVIAFAFCQCKQFGFCSLLPGWMWIFCFLVLTFGTLEAGIQLALLQKRNFDYAKWLKLSLQNSF